MTAFQPITIPTSTPEPELSANGQEAPPAAPEPRLNKWAVLEQVLKFKYEFRRNVITRIPEYRKANTNGEWLPVTDAVTNSILRNLVLEGYTYASDNLLVKIICSDYSPEYHPLKDYFLNLEKWDGTTDYIRQLADTITATVPPDVVARFLKKWLACVVANVIVDDDCMNHLVLVLSGKQGDMKSRWLHHLLPAALPKYISTTFIDPEEKDSLLATTQNLFVDLDDYFADISAQKINAFKGFITLPVVKVRLPYARFTEWLPKIASFMGSTNEDEFLFDETGTRRFLCFRIEKLDIAKALALNMDKVYSQARAIFQAGNYWLNKEEEAELETMNEGFKVTSFEAELIGQHFKVPGAEITADTYWTTSEVTNYLQAMTRKPVGKKRVGMALTRMGFKKTGKNINNVSMKVYELHRIFKDSEPGSKNEVLPPPVHFTSEPKEKAPF